MVRIKGFNKVSFQKKDNKYWYLYWSKNDLSKTHSWPRQLHLSELDQINIGPTILVEWEE